MHAIINVSQTFTISTISLHGVNPNFSAFTHSFSYVGAKAYTFSLEILSDEQKLAQFREQAFNSVTERFNSDDIVKQYEEIYYRITEGPA